MDIERLGPYKIGKQLGSGGMGTVYAAVEESTGEPAAVKVLAPQLAAHEGFRERFEAEIDSLKKLEHPGIVRLFGYGQQDTFIYYAMELIDGTSLEDELARGCRFTWRDVCQMGIDLCRALKLAHDHGIIHRDLKPANLLLTKDGNVKLTDFGIARLFGNTGVTAEGGVLGTAEYMAPEQADGRRVTHRCDLYSLGGVMYALLAGRPPFRSKSMLEMLQLQRFAEPEPVRRYAPDTPAEMEAIIAQLLEKDPQDRFPNALIVGRRLEAMLHGLTLKESREENDESNDEADSDLAHASDAEVSTGATMDAAESVDLFGSTRFEGEVSAVEETAAGESSASQSHVLSAEKPRENRFTTIEEDRREWVAQRRADHPLISAPTWFLIVAIVATGAIAWFLLQPASADALYSQIADAAGEEDEKRLLRVEDEVTEFLRYYPNDPRKKKVRRYQRRINALLLARRANLKARLLLKRFPESPVGPEYLAAIRLAETQPEQAVEQLRALIDLYGGAEELDPRINEFIVEAEQQLPRVEQHVRERAAQKNAILEARLQEAYKLLHENPAKSRRICNAIVQLYSDKPWATEVVTKAEATLTQLDKMASDSRGP